MKVRVPRHENCNRIRQCKIVRKKIHWNLPTLSWNGETRTQTLTSEGPTRYHSLKLRWCYGINLFVKPTELFQKLFSECRINGCFCIFFRKIYWHFEWVTSDTNLFWQRSENLRIRAFGIKLLSLISWRHAELQHSFFQYHKRITKSFS